MKITPREKGEGELARFARSTVPEEKWGLLVVYHQSSPHIIEGGRFFRNEERVLRKGGILVFFLIFFYPAHRVSPYVSGFRVLGAQGLALLNMHSLHAYIYPRIFGFYHTFGRIVIIMLCLAHLVIYITFVSNSQLLLVYI